MSFISSLTRHVHHPVTWLSTILYYLVFFTGAWLQNPWLMTLALTGVLLNLFFAPIPAHNPKWSEKLLKQTDLAWEYLSAWHKTGFFGIVFLSLAALIYGCWINSIWLIALSLIVLTVNKTSLLIYGHRLAKKQAKINKAALKK